MTIELANTVRNILLANTDMQIAEVNLKSGRWYDDYCYSSVDNIVYLNDFGNDSPYIQNLFDFLLVTCHEFKHADQYAKGYLSVGAPRNIPTRVNKYMYIGAPVKTRIWHGKIYDYDLFYMTMEDYVHLPWEKEAYMYQEKLAKMCAKIMGIDPIISDKVLSTVPYYTTGLNKTFLPLS